MSNNNFTGELALSHLSCSLDLERKNRYFDSFSDDCCRFYLDETPAHPIFISEGLTFTRHQSPDTEAMCNDGSAYQYYRHDGDPDTWVIYLQGGGACFREEECLSREAKVQRRGLFKFCTRFMTTRH